MHINISVNKQSGKGAHEFFAAFKELMKSAETWKVESANPKDATIESSATISSLPAQPRWKFTEHFAGGANIQCLNTEWTPAQKAHALGDLVYLCMTALGSFVAKIEIVP